MQKSDFFNIKELIVIKSNITYIFPGYNLFPEVEVKGTKTN